MTRFLALIQNEIIKINSKKQLIFFLLFCLLLIGGIGIANRIVPDMRAAVDYLKFANSMASFLAVFLVLFAIVLGAQSLYDEFKDGTIKQLLLRPVSRTSILLSKYTANVVVILFAALFLCVACAVIGLLLFGTGRSGTLTLGVVCKSYLYSLPDVLFIMTLSFFIAGLSKSSALSITISIFLYLAGEALTSLIPQKWGAKYIIFNNLNLKVYDQNPLLNGGIEAPFSGMSFGFSIMLIFLYVAALLFIEIIVFEKRDVY
ncbi:ABC transporter permease [Aneurinibacillus tyrosinisolvens]|uniref:ABC transporter permease n=1 Tax=Aneurinibacillus tyrosinisolvens TaxID=1443435 RepID=UPI00063F0DCC|nr:ABC transporter permease [Aneurinibacillus tyrosinisolvens]